MKDIQNQQDHRRINIEKVGVKEISYPVTVLDKAKATQRTVAKVNMSVNLPHHFKGTHMSRFVEILNQFHGEINIKNFHLILQEMKEKLEAEKSHMEIEFPFFLRPESPNKIADLPVEYACKMHDSLGETNDLILEIIVPINPPNSKQTNFSLPESLGHWGNAKIRIRFHHFIWIEDLIYLVENITKHDLEWSTNQPKPTNFHLSVEELARNLGQEFAKHPDISWYEVTVENFAQGFSTFATIESQSQ